MKSRHWNNCLVDEYLKDEWLERLNSLSWSLTSICYGHVKPDPDEWRLREFLIKQLNDGKLVKKYYRHLLQDHESWKISFERAVSK